jgi:hypothetical protein
VCVSPLVLACTVDPIEPRMSNKSNSPEAFYQRICDILTAARSGIARTVNTTQVL